MQDYKPQFMHWKLVLLTRKLVFALVVVLLNHAVEAQVRFGGLNSSFYFKFFVVLANLNASKFSPCTGVTMSR